MIHQYLLPSHYVPIVDSEAIETGKLRVVTQPYESVRIVMYVIHLILESIFDSLFFFLLQMAFGDIVGPFFSSKMLADGEWAIE